MRSLGYALAIAGMFGSATARAGERDEGWRRDRGDYDHRRFEHREFDRERGRDRWEHERWEHDRDRGYYDRGRREGYYAPPPVYYAPALRPYYAPPPVYAPPGVGIYVPFR